MRAILGAAGGLLVAGTLIAAPADTQALGGLNSVTVSPSHGKAAVPFQVTYAISPCQGAAGLTITFAWGALPPAGQVLGTAVTDSACRATLSTTPPLNAATHQSLAPGSYQVFGYVALPTGTPTPNTEASTTYSIDITPAPTATASPSSGPSASAPGNPATSPSASAPAVADQSNAAATPSASAPAVADQSNAAATAGAGKPAVYKSSGQPGWWTLFWPVVLGAAVLALAALALLVVWILGRRRARAAPDVDNDRAA